jgi:hypothetical protein
MKIEIESKYNINDIVYIKYKLDTVFKCCVLHVVTRSFIEQSRPYTKIYYKLYSNAENFIVNDYEEMYVYDNIEQCMK